MRRSSHHRPLLLAAALTAAAGLAGCAYQDPLSLPPLGPSGGASSTSPYYGYGGGYYDPRYGSVYSYGYDPLRRHYDPRYGYYYSGAYPGYYGPLPYPAPGYYPYPRGPYCVDANRDGRCDRRGGGDGDGHGGGSNGNGNGSGNGGGQGPGLDPKRDPFEQVREVTRRAERAETAPATPASMSPNAPRQQQPRAGEAKRSVEPRRESEPRRVAPPKDLGWKAVGDDAGGARPRRAPREDASRPAPDVD